MSWELSFIKIRIVSVIPLAFAPSTGKKGMEFVLTIRILLLTIMALEYFDAHLISLRVCCRSNPVKSAAPCSPPRMYHESCPDLRQKECFRH